jgi:hypothetical protein
MLATFAVQLTHKQNLPNPTSTLWRKSSYYCGDGETGGLGERNGTLIYAAEY